jgi:segregation and condensation protein B
MDTQYIRNVIEAGLLAAGRPLRLEELAALFGETERPGTAAIRECLGLLEQEYAARALELKETASGVRIQVRREFATEVSRLWPERPRRYSRALLETLALIAYRQPITRAEIEAVRGVAVNPDIIRTLLERSWVRVVGHRELPGRPELLGTTREFLDYFGLRSVAELPPLAQIRSLEEIDPQLALPVAAGAVAAGTGAAETGAAAGSDLPAAESVPEAAAAMLSDEAGDPDEEPGNAAELGAPGAAAPGLVAAGPTAAD